ncbi:putative FAD binding domain containing protein [Lyophyllum shimeji]|uniref:FAD binding domain containing protein n=1 Tax=Lyophyllum shimeji TaxID=47721 RepID=A0A9P3PS61_LYOSH|nr:putative FAD binding domain containing protein [Lyophyllum shimeji]
MESTSPEVLVVGAGPSGLICALSLLRNGIPVRVIEKSLEPRRGQRGAGIMPRSQELFDSLGLKDIFNLAIVSPPMRRYELKSSNPTSEFEMVPRSDPTPSYPYLNVICLGQDRLEEVIRASLAEYACKVEYGTELISLEQVEDGVNVKLFKHESIDEKNDVAETARFDWVVGADGARGVVRKQSPFTFHGETWSEEKLVVGDIYLEGLSPKYWHLYGGATGILISLRPTETAALFNFTIAGNVDVAQLSSDEAAVKRFLTENVGSEAELKPGEITWLSTFTPNIRMVETLQQGRVFLVGDAGHVHSPTGGQGMNSGVQDSYNLAWKLALVQRKLAPHSLLQSYSEERIPVIRSMLDQTTQLLKRTFSEKGNAPFTRDGGLLQLGVNYRWSSIVLDKRKLAKGCATAEGAQEERLNAYGGHADGPLRAGDRAPDASEMVDVTATPQASGRLFKILAPSRHTVLIFTPAHNQCAALIQSLAQYPQGTVQSAVIVRGGHDVPDCPGANVVLEDREGHAHTGYGIVNDWGVVVVRPDGVIGAILGGPEGLQKYFEGIFGLST